VAVAGVLGVSPFPPFTALQPMRNPQLAFTSRGRRFQERDPESWVGGRKPSRRPFPQTREPGVLCHLPSRLIQQLRASSAMCNPMASHLQGK